MTTPPLPPEIKCPTLDYIAEMKVWNTNLERKLFIEIVHWGVKRGNPAWKSLNNGNGAWNYYILIPEHIMSKELFEKEFWLESKLQKYSEAGAEYETYNYMSASFADVNWHCGITFYERQGQTVGHRSVKLGCDYSHIWDEDRDYLYTIQEVLQDAWQTAVELKQKYNL